MRIWAATFVCATAWLAALWAQDPAAKPATQPCPAEESESGPPRLRRGKPGERKPANCEPAATPIPLPAPAQTEDRDAAVRTGAAPVERDEDEAKPIPTAVDKVRQRVPDYLASLPNFTCEQIIKRLEAKNYKSAFKQRDVISVDVFYDGVEDYRNVKRNGKPVKDYDAVKDTGSWSSGEFGTVLNDVLSPATQGEFVFRKKELIDGAETDQYDFFVRQANSHWTLSFDGHTTKPAYRGRIWVDTKESMLRRIEMESRNLPATFPVDHAELTLDYGPVTIAGVSYFLPVRTANLACFRYREVCTQNQSEFRNYRRFTTESNISTTESTVTFDGEKKESAPAAAPQSPKKKKK